MKRNASRVLKDVARQSRRQPTIAERILWNALRDDQLCGLSFRRQHAIGQSIADFCCLSRKLIVEADGGVHDLQEDRDQARDKEFRTLGFTTLRLSNELIQTNLKLALQLIKEAARSKPPPPTPAPASGGGEYGNE